VLETELGDGLACLLFVAGVHSYVCAGGDACRGRVVSEEFVGRMRARRSPEYAQWLERLG